MARSRPKLSIRPETGWKSSRPAPDHVSRPLKYQMVIESMEMAGEGALKLLEDRRRQLTAEGLFDAERKLQPLSAVRDRCGDVAHRGCDREFCIGSRTGFRAMSGLAGPGQGDGAKDQIAAAIGVREADARRTPAPSGRSDCRGGSLEDLGVQRGGGGPRRRPINPADLYVGHEDDTTLIDFASDRRAPTPTAAAEMAVPVRDDLLAQVMATASACSMACGGCSSIGTRLCGLARGLPGRSG